MIPYIYKIPVTQDCEDPIKEISIKTGLSRDMVLRALDQLEKQGMIKIEFLKR
jgi:DNA-binding Lrp family transcriptional regulator